MIYHANPLENQVVQDFSNKQTVEFRCPDGSADIYLLLAGLTVAARHGLELDEALRIAEQTYVDVNIFDEEHKERLAQLKQLPVSCWDSAERLMEHADIYNKYGVFPLSVLDGTARKLKSFNDKGLRERLEKDLEQLQKVVNQYIHCG